MKLSDEEFKEFRKNNKPFDYGDEFVDGCCNRWSQVIYQIDDKLYAIETLEGEPLKAYTDKGYVDYYELKEVIKKEEIRYYYVPIEEESNETH